jgi:hypothetical protein
MDRSGFAEEFGNDVLQAGSPRILFGSFDENLPPIVK